MIKSKKQSTRDVQVSELGKLPPQALDLEEAILGALMLDKDAFSSVSEIIHPESFYKESHQLICRAIYDLSQQDQPVDLYTVIEKLKSKGELDQIGGAYYLTELSNKVSSAAHIVYHAQIVAQKHLQRELIHISSDVLNQAFDDTTDVVDLLSMAEGKIFEVSQRNSHRDAMQINPLIDEAMRNISEAAKRPDGLSGMPSGFTQLDKITSGWQRSDLVVIAARPAMGKTAFVLSMARQMALDHKQGIAIFSLEMSNVQLVNRLIVSETEIPGEKIKNGNLTKQEWVQLESKVTALQDAPIYVDDTPALSIFELRTKARRLVSKHNIKMIMIDYLQLMTAAGMSPGSREQEVSMISRSLKGLAKELNIPIVALSQLNRGVEGRSGLEGKRPQLSDLRESGAIEQDADMVIFIHRPEYYKLTEDAEGRSLIGIAELIIAKHRNGATGDVRLRFIKDLAQFKNEDDDEYANLRSAQQSGAVTYSSQINHDIPSGDFGNEEYKDPILGNSEEQAPF